MQAHTDVVHAQKVGCDVAWNVAAGSAELKLESTRHGETVLHAMNRRKLMTMETQVADMQSYSGLKAETLKTTQKYWGEKVTMEQEGMKSQRLQTAASTA